MDKSNKGAPGSRRSLMEKHRTFSLHSTEAGVLRPCPNEARSGLWTWLFGVVSQHLDPLPNHLKSSTKNA